MKQHITESDLNQLTDNGREKLRTWWIPQDGDSVLFRGEEQLYYHYEYDGSDQVTIEDWELKNTYPLLSIGQMIEFLDEYNIDRAFDALCFDRGEYEWHVYHLEKPNNHRSVELCNALWSACVEILNK